MTDYAPFPLIDLSGSPRERGRTHGKAKRPTGCGAAPGCTPSRS